MNVSFEYVAGAGEGGRGGEYLLLLHRIKYSRNTEVCITCQANAGHKEV